MVINTADSNAKEHLMPTYMDVHDGFVGVTQEQFDEAHRRDLAIQAEEGVSYDHAWLDPESGKAFCPRWPEQGGCDPHPRAGWTPGKRSLRGTHRG